MGIRVGDLYSLPFPSINVTVLMNSGENRIKVNKHPISTENVLGATEKVTKGRVQTSGNNRTIIGKKFGVSNFSGTANLDRPYWTWDLIFSLATHFTASLLELLLGHLFSIMQHWKYRECTGNEAPTDPCAQWPQPLPGSLALQIFILN